MELQDPILMAKLQMLSILNAASDRFNERELVTAVVFLLILRKEHILVKTDLNGENLKNILQPKIKNLQEGKFQILKETLEEITSLFNDLDEVVSSIYNVSEEVFQQIYLDWIEASFDFYYSNHKLSKDSFYPKELNELMTSFLPEKKELSVYNPFAGLGTFTLNLPKKSTYLGQEKNRGAWLLGKLRLLAHNLTGGINFENSDSFKFFNNQIDNYYDTIIFSQPLNINVPNEQYFSARDKTYILGNSTNFIISECLKRLNKTGKMIFCTTSNFLNSSDLKDNSLKKYLIKNDYIERIISLPSKILMGTSIPVSLLVINKVKQNEGKIQLINAEDCFVKDKFKNRQLDLNQIYSLVDSTLENDKLVFVDNLSVISNGYNLKPLIYIFNEEEKCIFNNEDLIKLDQVLESIPLKVANDIDLGKIIYNTDLHENSKLIKENFQYLEDRKITSSPLINQDSLLLSLVGRNLRPTFFTTSEANVFCSRDIKAFNVNQDLIKVDYLILELNKDYVINQVNRLSNGNLIHKISLKELFTIKILLPSLKEQSNIIEGAKRKIVLKEQENLKSLIAEYSLDVADENSFLRHQIAGAVKNSKKSFKSLVDIIQGQLLDKHEGLMELKLKSNSTLTFGKYIDIITRDLESISQSVKRVSNDIKLSEKNFEEIDIVKFIKNYIDEVRERSSGNYSVQLLSEVWIEENLKRVIVTGNEQMLREMFDNLVENAEKHGFKNSNYKNHELVFEVMFGFETNEMQINVSNTGLPLPENFNNEVYKRKGSTAGLNAGDGFGGYFVNNVMKQLGGSIFDVYDHYHAEYQGELVNNTVVELLFPIKLEYNE